MQRSLITFSVFRIFNSRKQSEIVGSHTLRLFQSILVDICHFQYVHVQSWCGG